ANVGSGSAIMTITKIDEARIEKSKLASDTYCKALALKMMEPGQKIVSAETSAIRRGLDTCAIHSTTATGRKIAGVIMFGKSNPYLVMTTVEKDQELPVESLQAFADTWYLK
ncbi:MAG TPA: hypothetical protein VM432_10710, partial [Bdellovibrionales bacterium]|nr:hypothetical protein [Bdellovibrionales bacterium]